MSLRLNTGVMQYRESQNDVWKPMVIKTNLDWESLAEDYDATSAYEVGTYVLYNAELYRCTTAVPTGGEAWNTAHWLKVDFGSELNSLTEDVNELQEIAGDGALSGFTATDLTGAANELKNTLNQLGSDVDAVETSVSKILPVITGATNNSGHTIIERDYFEANGTLYKATASIPVDSAWASSASAVSNNYGNGAVNALNILSHANCTAASGVSNQIGFVFCGNVGIPTGYLQITTAKEANDILVTVGVTPAMPTEIGNTTIALISNSTGLVYPIYVRPNGELVAAGNIPTGFYVMAGAIFKK